VYITSSSKHSVTRLIEFNLILIIIIIMIMIMIMIIIIMIIIIIIIIIIKIINKFTHQWHVISLQAI